MCTADKCRCTTMKGRRCARDGEFAGLCVGAPGASPAGPPVSGVGVPAGIYKQLQPPSCVRSFSNGSNSHLNDYIDTRIRSS